MGVIGRPVARTQHTPDRGKGKENLALSSAVRRPTRPYLRGQPLNLPNLNQPDVDAPAQLRPGPQLPRVDPAPHRVRVNT